MKLEDIKKELLKQKDAKKYLENLLKKIKDKNLIKEIKELIEKLKSLQEQKPKLESIVRSAPRVPVEEEEERAIRRTVTRARPSITLGVPEKKEEDYGIKVGKADYDTTTENVKRKLQESHQVTEHGFTSSAETRHLIDKKMGEYHSEKGFQEEKPKYHKFEHVQENRDGLTNLEKEIKKKKLERDYK